MFEDNQAGFFTGLFLIALGSGGIKPCVATFVGDQFDQSNKSLAKLVHAFEPGIFRSASACCARRCSTSPSHPEKEKGVVHPAIGHLRPLGARLPASQFPPA